MKELGFAVNRPQDILDGIREHPTLMTWELCPVCEEGVRIRAYGRSICPSCGAPISPCARCGTCREPCVYDALQKESEAGR